MGNTKKLLFTLTEITEGTNSKEFIVGCLNFLNKTGYLTPKQRQGILKVIHKYV